MSLQYLKKEVRDELGFLHADKHQTDILKALKGTSLQYLYSISKKKEASDGVYLLHADKHQSFYKLALSFFMEMARYVQSTQNRNLVIFL